MIELIFSNFLWLIRQFTELLSQHRLWVKLLHWYCSNIKLLVRCVQKYAKTEFFVCVHRDKYSVVIIPMLACQRNYTSLRLELQKAPFRSVMKVKVFLYFFFGLEFRCMGHILVILLDITCLYSNSTRDFCNFEHASVLIFIANTVTWHSTLCACPTAVTFTDPVVAQSCNEQHLRYKRWNYLGVCDVFACLGCSTCTASRKAAVCMPNQHSLRLYTKVTVSDLYYCVLKA